MRVLTAVLMACLVSRRLHLPARLAASATGLAAVRDARFAGESLALPAGEGIRCLGPIRRQWAHTYQLTEHPALPRYAGAGETSIHKAIQELHHLIAQGAARQAIQLIRELERDLHLAQQTGDIDALMTKWNARYPSELPVDVLGVHIPQFLTTLEALWLIMPEDPEDVAYVTELQRMVQAGLKNLAKDMGYDSLEDFVRDAIVSDLYTATDFQVHVSPSLRRFVEGATSITINVIGMPTFQRVTLTILRQFPALNGPDWILRIDDREPESDYELILPGQRLELIVPDPRKEGGNRPKNPASESS